MQNQIYDQVKWKPPQFDEHLYINSLGVEHIWNWAHQTINFNLQKS